MKSEYWELLNGSGWGDEPQRDDMELDIPAFMFESTQSVLVPAAVYRAQGLGRVKHQVRSEKKQRRDFRNGIAYMVMIFGALALANVLVEVICR